MLNGINKIIPSMNNLMEKISSKRKVTAPDILKANQILIDYLNNNNVVIKYKDEIKDLPERKMLWE